MFIPEHAETSHPNKPPLQATPTTCIEQMCCALEHLFDILRYINTVFIVIIIIIIIINKSPQQVTPTFCQLYS